MSLFSKLFGISKLEEEFKKAIALKWCLAIENIQQYTYNFEGNALRINSESSIVIFDFQNLTLNIYGSLSAELLSGETLFMIRKTENHAMVRVSRTISFPEH